MTIGSKEHHELMKFFERRFSSLRLDREKNREQWKTGNIYEAGETNTMFLAFREGYALGKVS